MNRELLLKPDFILRAITLLAIVMICSFFIAIKSKEAFAVALKSHSVVTEDVFRLSDIFTDIDIEKDLVLGISPNPGDDITLNARTLLRLSSVYDLGWRPDSVMDRITIRRNASRVSEDTIRASIVDEIKLKMNSSKIKIKISGELPKFNLSPELPASVEVVSLKFNKGGWFEAEIASPSADNPVKTARIYGEVGKLVTIPIVRSTLRNGDIIGATDIEWIDVGERDIQHNTILKAEKLIGKTPRRIIHAGQTLRDSELELPQLVKRGESVTIIFENGALSLSAAGKALQGGAQGDFIRVVNAGSNRTIEAMVEDTRLVRITR